MDRARRLETALSALPVDSVGNSCVLGGAMGSFEELLEAAGYVRDATVVGAIHQQDRPPPDQIERLYDEVAEAASVDPDSLMLEFVPLPAEPGSDPRIEVAVWYDGDLEPGERDRVAAVLRQRFATARARSDSGISNRKVRRSPTSTGRSK